MDEMEKQRIDKKLYESIFYSEAKQIPIEILGEDEKEIILKCVNREEATQDEITELKRILAKYRNILKEYNVQEIEDNVEKVNKDIRTERELLRLLEDEENYKLRMRYYHHGEEYILHLVIKPLKDSQVIFEMEEHLELFRDCSPTERVLLDKVANNVVMSPEELKMVEHLNKKLEDKMYTQENVVRAWTEFIARQVEFENGELTTHKEKLEFWNKIDINTRYSLYQKIRSILKLDESFTDDLFLDD